MMYDVSQLCEYPKILQCVYLSVSQCIYIYTVPENNIAPENWWLQDYFPCGFRPIFRCYVRFRECIYIVYIYIHMHIYSVYTISVPQKFVNVALSNIAS